MSYREVWDKAVSEGKGGTEKGKPCMDFNFRLKESRTRGCHLQKYTPRGDLVVIECTHLKVKPEKHPCKICHAKNSNKDFFWPSDEKLPTAR